MVMWGCLYLIFNCMLSFPFMQSAYSRLKIPCEVSVSINGTKAFADVYLMIFSNL